MSSNRNYDDRVYRRARLRVLRRDRHHCQMPNCKNTKKLHVHHIQPWSRAAALRFEEDNMITLCKTCHESIKDIEHVYVGLFAGIVYENNKRH